MAIEVDQAGPVHHGPGSRPARLLSSRHPAFGRRWTVSPCAPPTCLSATIEATPVLEAVFMGPEMRFTADAIVAVTGAELPPKVDGDARADLDDSSW